MTDFNGPDPSTLSWGCSEAVFAEHEYWTGVFLIPSTYTVTAYTLPEEGEMYANPGLQVRCYLHTIADMRWMEVLVSQGPSSGLGHPNPNLFHHNRAAIELAIRQAGETALPEDIRLYQQGTEWIQIGTLAAA